MLKRKTSQNGLEKLRNISKKDFPMGYVTNYEDDLIKPSEWRNFYNEMPIECQEIVDADPWSLGGPTGIGRNEELGWFVCGSGQGPFLIWSEKQNDLENK